VGHGFCSLLHSSLKESFCYTKIALEDIFGLFYVPQIVFFGLIAFARSETIANVVFQANLIPPLRDFFWRKIQFAGPDREQGPDQFQYILHSFNACERPKIGSLGRNDLARWEDAGKMLVC